MEAVRRSFRLVTVLITLVLAVIVSGPQGALPIGIASAHTREIVQRASQQQNTSDAQRFVPDIHAPQTKATAWHPPTAPNPPDLKSVAASPAPVAKPVLSTAGRTPGEQRDLRTQTTSTVLNADGTWTLQAYSQPVHYQDAQGQWQDINTSVVSDSSDAGFAFGNKANSWHIHFAAHSGAGYLTHVQFPDVTLMDKLDGAASVTATTSGPLTLYPGVFPGVDLQYGVRTESVEAVLLLHNAQVPASYSFTYHVPNTSAQVDVAGNVIFTNAKGEQVLVIGGLSMYEADAHGAPLPTGMGTDRVQVALSGKAPDFTVTYTPDSAWLHDPARHFPVAVDPSYSPSFSGAQQGGGTNGNEYGDTLDESGNPALNFWNSNDLRIGNCNVNPPGYNTGTSRSYIKFGIGGAPASNLRVTSATLQLYQLSSYAGAEHIFASPITSAWDEKTLTWNNHPTGTIYGGSGYASTGYNTWISLNVSVAAYAWWQGGLALNGFQLKYSDESKACDLFASDDYGSNLPKLTINYVTDNTVPGGSVTINDGAPYTNDPNVTLGTTYSDAGATNAWSSNWTSVNGVSANAGTAPAWSVDAAGSELTATTATCGSANCPVQTFFTATGPNMHNWPTFTAAFKSDLGGPFNFGVVESGDNGTRFDLVAPAGGSAFTRLEESGSYGAYSSQTVNIPFSANTWYYGQVDFPFSNVGEIYIWPVGQVRPSRPSVYWTGISMTQPGLNFWEQGTDGSGLHQYSIANVTISNTDTGASSPGYGVWGMDFSNDNAHWHCPTPGSDPWCVAGGRAANWTLATGGDGNKTVYVRYVDNAGNVETSLGSDQIVLDTTPPTASVTAPTAGSEVRGKVIVTGTATDPLAPDGTNTGVHDIWLYVDGQRAGSFVEGTSVPTFVWDTTNVAPGEHTLALQAIDYAGNAGMSASVTVDVANTGEMGYELFARRALPAGDIAAGVNAANGNLVVTQQDLAIPGRGLDLTLGREYNALTPVNGLFGWGWSSNFDVGLTTNSDLSLIYHDASGGYHLFRPNGSGGYLTPPGIFATLVKNADSTYTLTSKDQTKTNFNVAGYVTSIVDRNGNTLSVTYNTTNQPTTVTDAVGRQLTLTISNGHITDIAAPGSRTYGYAYDASGNLTDYTDPAGTVTHYTYDGNHRLTKIMQHYVSGGASDQQTNVATTLTYDTNNRLVQLVDPLGYDVGVSYSDPYLNSGGQMVGEQVTVKQLQTNANTTPSSSNSVYEVTTYTAATDNSGAIAVLATPVGTTYYFYNTDEQVTKVVDPNGNVSTTSYDGNGNPLSSTVDPGSAPHLNLTTSYTYDSANNMLTATTPAGVVTQYTYDAPATGNLVKQVANYVSGGPSDSQTNVTTSYGYDSYGEPVSKTDPLGVVTQYTYDSQGDLLSTTQNYQQGVPADNQTNVTSSSTYDDLSEQLTATDPLGVVTKYTYDIRGNLMQTVANYKQGMPADSQTNVTTGYGYDPLGRLVSTTDPLGVVTETVYDADGRAIKSIQNYVSGQPSDSQTNVTTTTAYDAAGNATLATDPKGNTTTTTYDAANRATEVVTKSSAADGSVQISDRTTSYDADGHVIASQTKDGASDPTTTATYDAAGRQVTVTAPPANPGASDASGQSNVTTVSYDKAGNAVESKVTNSAVSGAVSDTTVAYSKLSQPTSKTEQAGTSAAQTTSYTYDKAGQQASQTDPSGTSHVDRDSLGRVVTAWHPDGSQDSATYDKAGHTLTSSDGTKTTTYVYDPLWRVSSEQVKDVATGTVEQTTSYAYDANGNQLTPVTTYADGTQSGVTYTYDKLGRIQTMSDGTRSFVYDASGNLTTMKVLNGSATAVEEDFNYDGGNRPVGLTDKVGPSGTALHTYSFTYDGRGNAGKIVSDAATTTYTYDNANQLLSATTGSAVTSYSYDANHNRTKVTTSAGMTTYGYDSSDTELTSKTDTNGKVTTYAYDASGNLSTATFDASGANQQTTYKYNSKNLLSEIDQPDGGTVSFTYDADGNRLTKTVVSGGPVPTQTMVKDVYQAGRIAYETDGAGTTLATFSYDPAGIPTSVVVGTDPNTGPRYYYVYNGHGDVVALVDGSGNIAARYSYDEFGAITDSSETFVNGWSNPYRYDGKDRVRYDNETGLYWMSVRAYDPTLGRFISRDPQGRTPLVFATQPYAYAGNNPLRNIDPSGQRYFDPGDPDVQAPPFGAPHRSSWVQPTHGTEPTGSSSSWCSATPHCKSQYDKWKAWIDPILGGGVFAGVAADMLVFATEGIPFIGELGAIAAGNLEMLGTAALHLADLLFATNDFVRAMSELVGAQPDGGLVSFLRSLEAVTGTLDLVANLVGGIFTLFNPLQGLEGAIQKFLLPKLRPGFASMGIFLAVHLGATWLPEIMGISAEAFDAMSMDEAMSRFPWMIDISPPNLLAGH